MTNRADRRRANAIGEQVLAAVAGFTPAATEYTSIDMVMRQTESGAVRAFVAVTCNQTTLIMSRGSWEFVLPQLLRHIYGGRVAEAGIHKALAGLPPDVPDEALVDTAARASAHYGGLVLNPHPMEMTAVTEEADAAAMEDRVERLRSQLPRAMRGKGGGNDPRS